MISILYCILISCKRCLFIYQVSSQAPTKSPSISAFSVFLHVSRALLKFSSCWEIIEFDQFSLMIHNHVDLQLKIPLIPFYPFRSMWSISCLNGEIILIRKKYHNWKYLNKNALFDNKTLKEDMICCNNQGI